MFCTLAQCTCECLGCRTVRTGSWKGHAKPASLFGSKMHVIKACSKMERLASWYRCIIKNQSTKLGNEKWNWYFVFPGNTKIPAHPLTHPHTNISHGDEKILKISVGCKHWWCLFFSPLSCALVFDCNSDNIFLLLCSLNRFFTIKSVWRLSHWLCTHSWLLFRFCFPGAGNTHLDVPGKSTHT